MRRLSGFLGLVLFLAPVGLRFAVAAEDTEAMRCALACGHALGAVKGAACCPMGDAPETGPSFKSCSRGGDAAVAPMAPGPMFLASRTRLEPPVASRRFWTDEDAVPRAPFLRAPDKVPLLFG